MTHPKTELLNLSIAPDSWSGDFDYLREAEDYSDDSFAGCEYRLPSPRLEGVRYAVNVKITGRKSHWVPNCSDEWYRTRVQIEFVGDGEESNFVGGWVYSAYPLKEVPLN